MRRARWTSQQVVERGQRAAACLEKEKKRERVGARGRQTAPARGRETPFAGQNEKGTTHVGDAGARRWGRGGGTKACARAKEKGRPWDREGERCVVREGGGVLDVRQSGRKGRVVSTRSARVVPPPRIRHYSRARAHARHETRISTHLSMSLLLLFLFLFFLYKSPYTAAYSFDLQFLNL